MTQNTFPFTLANLAGGNQPVADIDSNFNVVCRGDSVTVVGNVPTWGDTAGKYPTAGLTTTPATGTITTLVGLDGSNRLPVADGSQLTNLPSAPWVGVRQTVAAGPTTSAGLPNFLPASSGSLSISTQNISGTAPFVASAANNWSASTGVATDRVGLTTTSLTWTVLGSGAAVTNYLYVTASGGTLTAASTSLAPIYQWGGVPATTNGQFTFNIGSMQGFLGNGATAPQTYAVFVGEAAASGGAISSTVQYAYNGEYESGFTATLPSASTTFSANHNLGIKPSAPGVLLIECTTSDQGFSPGDQITSGSGLIVSGAPNIGEGVVLSMTTNVVSSVAGSSTPWVTVNKGTGANAVITVANWKYKFIVRRGW